MTLQKYKAFISYSHADETWARWLHEALETYRIPKRLVRELKLPGDRLTPIFRDRDELASSGSLSGVIQEALLNSEFLIVVCSRNAANSSWVNEEIRHFKTLGRSERVLCVLVDEPGVSFPASALAEYDTAGCEVSAGNEPLAADARDDFDGKETAKLKIIAGMIHVGLDELIRRDATRGQRRLLTIALAAVTGMALTSALAFYAIEQRNFARIQQWQSILARDEAVASRDSAELATAQAEQVVNFLIGMFELFDPGESLGNAVTAREVLNQARERTHADLDEQPLTQARLLATMGSVYQALGLFEEARELKEEAYTIRRAQLGEEHEDTLASIDSLASIALHQGNHEVMEQYARESLRINRELYGDKHPNTLGALSDLSTAVSRLGSPDLAVQYSNNVLRMARELEDLDPSELEVYVRRAAIYLSAVGEYERAEILYKESLELSRQVYGELAPNVAFALDNLALHYLDLERHDLAEPLFWEALEMLRQIYGPTHPEVAQTMGNVASFIVESGGDLEQARQLLDSALEIDRELRPQHEFVGGYLATLALVEASRHNYPKAETHWRESLEVYAYSLGPQEPEVLASRAGLARSLLAQNKLADAETLLMQCYRELVNQDSEQKILVDVIEDLVVLYERYGQPARASQFRTELEVLAAG